MNRNCHRIVFNVARGQLMAVAETAQRCGKSASGESPSGAAAAHSPALLHPIRQTTLAALVAMGAMFAGAPVALAQIIADPTAPANQRPTVLSDSAGRPLVNIQTPSAAGLSRNTYRQFDVPTGGIVLNNAASNPWLANGVLAKTILNEVNSTSPSYLNGAITVNGGSAQVIVANPNGIQVNGGSFSNASRATLTTGTAQVSNGALTGFDVRRGTVTIGASGLNNSATPYTDVLSQAVSVAGKLQAQNLGITTGKQTVSYDTGLISTQDTAAATGAAAYAIDTGALGGMYANNISILATETGLGVRNQGTWQASGGQIVVTADGLLRNQGAVSANVVSLATVSGDIENVGNIQGSQAVLLSSGRDVRLSGAGLTQTAGSAVVVSAQKGIALESNASVKSTATGGQVTLSARETVQLAAGSTVAGQAGVTIVSDTQVQATGTQLSSSGGSLNLLAGSGMNLTGSSINAKSIQIETGKALAETNAGITLNSNNLNSTGALTVLATGALSTSSNSLSAGTHLHMGSAGTLSSQSDQLRASSIELIGSSVTANSLDATASTGSLKVSSSAGAVDIIGTYDKTGKLAAGTDLVITALGGDARLTAVQATADHIKVNATGDTLLTGAFGLGSSYFGKQTFAVRSSSLIARKSLSLATVGAGKVLNLGGSYLEAATADLSLTSAGSIDLVTASVNATQGSISAVSAGAISGVGSGMLRSGQNLSIDAGQGNLVIAPWQGQFLSAGRNLSMTARNGDITLSGLDGSAGYGSSQRVSITTQGNLTFVANNINLYGSVLRANGGAIKLTATTGNLNVVANKVRQWSAGFNNTYWDQAELVASNGIDARAAGDISLDGVYAHTWGQASFLSGGNLTTSGKVNRWQVDNRPSAGSSYNGWY